MAEELEIYLDDLEKKLRNGGKNTLVLSTILLTEIGAAVYKVIYMAIGECGVEVLQKKYSMQQMREMERMVKALDKKEKPEKKKDTFYTEAEISLAKALETNVSIIPGKKKSTIQIEFYSDEDLTDIVNRLANSK